MRAKKRPQRRGAPRKRESHEIRCPRGDANQSDRPTVLAGTFQSLFPDFFAVAAVPGLLELVKLDGPPLRPFAEDLGYHPGPWHEHLIRHLVDFPDGPGIQMRVNGRA